MTARRSPTTPRAARALKPPARSGLQATAQPEATAAERWRVDAGADTKAVLDIPGALARRRIFDIDVRFVVRVPDPAGAAWHALEVEVDGRKEWSRRIPSNNPGQTDSLDYHCRLDLEPGRAVRVRAAAAAQGAVPLQLRIDAEEASR